MTHPPRGSEEPRITTFDIAPDEHESLARSCDADRGSVVPEGHLSDLRGVGPKRLPPTAFEIVDVPASPGSSRSPVGNRESPAVGEPHDLANVEAHGLEPAHGSAFHVLELQEPALGVRNPLSVARDDADRVPVADGTLLSRGGHVAKTGLRKGVPPQKQDDGEDGKAAHRSAILNQVGA
jgi:hypothetical protein